MDSDRALDLPECPKKIAIIGGGYIGCEFACIFQNFGSEVHLVFRQDLPLRGFDGECRKFLNDQLEVRGLNMHHCSSPTSVVKNDDGTYKLTIVDPDNIETVIDGVRNAPRRRSAAGGGGHADELHAPLERLARVSLLFRCCLRQPLGMG